MGPFMLSSRSLLLVAVFGLVSACDEPVPPPQKPAPVVVAPVKKPVAATPAPVAKKPVVKKKTVDIDFGSDGGGGGGGWN